MESDGEHDREDSGIHLILATTDVPTCLQLRAAFGCVMGVTILQKDIDKVEDYDVVVVGSNSFGTLECPAGVQVRRLFGERIVSTLQLRILEECWGEQPVGTCLLIPTESKAHPFIAHSPISRWTETLLNTDAVYRCVWAALIEIGRHNQRARVRDEPQLRRILIPSLGWQGNQVLPEPQSASRQIALAYANFLTPLTANVRKGANPPAEEDFHLISGSYGAKRAKVVTSTIRPGKSGGKSNNIERQNKAKGAQLFLQPVESLHESTPEREPEPSKDDQSEKECEDGGSTFSSAWGTFMNLASAFSGKVPVPNVKMPSMQGAVKIPYPASLSGLSLSKDAETSKSSEQGKLGADADHDSGMAESRKSPADAKEPDMRHQHHCEDVTRSEPVDESKEDELPPLDDIQAWKERGLGLFSYRKNPTGDGTKLNMNIK